MDNICTDNSQCLKYYGTGGTPNYIYYFEVLSVSGAELLIRTYSTISQTTKAEFLEIIGAGYYRQHALFVA